MARLRHHRALFLIAGVLTLLAHASPAPAQETAFYDRPVLVLDPDRHTAAIRSVDGDAEGRWIVTGSQDKTVRIWSVADGSLIKTIRMPAGPNNVGKIFAVAMSPDGHVLAAGGWTNEPLAQIYVFESNSGDMSDAIQISRVITNLPDVVYKLAFSPNNRYLAAVLSNGGLRVYDRDRSWMEVARDADYSRESYGLAFARDGRLATTAYDGRLRLYDRYFRRIAMEMASGERPSDIAFSPDGDRLAVGYSGAAMVEVRDGYTLRTPVRLTLPEPPGMRTGLHTVAWSSDGQKLMAAGRYPPVLYPDSDKHKTVTVWSTQSTDIRQTLKASTDTITDLLPLPNGDLLVAAHDPYLARLGQDGKTNWAHGPEQADYRAQYDRLAVSRDGEVVEFGYEFFGSGRARFDLREMKLTLDPPGDGIVVTPVQDGLPVANWMNTERPSLAGVPLPLEDWAFSRSLAIHPQGDRFVLGTDNYVRAFDAIGKLQWHRDVPGVVWALNISGNGRLVVAAYSDGTIRWHRMDNGAELLAFFPLGDRKNWVAWTPEGFYAASPGAHGFLRWHQNRGWDHAADSVPVANIPGYYRPEILPIVLQELETARAVGLVTMVEQRRKTQRVLNSSIPPGAKLHILTIGVSEPGPGARHLDLKWAAEDATDFASALMSAQGDLYTVLSQSLINELATRKNILQALDTLRKNSADSSPGDLAVVHFSGHGAKLDGEYFLIPHGVDASSRVGLVDTALPLSRLRTELAAVNGSVLVLLDACRSGTATSGGEAVAADAAGLKTGLEGGNVSVLTSSSGDQSSVERGEWENGAFTEILLEALGRRADTDSNGLLSVTELASYLAAHVPSITNGEQKPDVAVRFQRSLFAVGL